PMHEGVIADYDTTAEMVKYYMKKAMQKRSFFASKPNVIVCVPSGITKVEERAVIDATMLAGARKAYPIAEPFAAAIGAGLPVWEPTGSMIVDIGGGTTEVAVVSLGGIVTCQSIKTAGDNMDAAIVEYIRQKHNLLIGDRSAESVKMDIGAAGRITENKTVDVRGRDLISGLPRTISVSAEDVGEALQSSVNNVISAIRATLEKTPPELAADIINRGVVLAGGGSLLENLDRVISDETNIPVVRADEALDCVAIGTGKSLDYMDHFKKNTSVISRHYLE